MNKFSKDLVKSLMERLTMRRAGRAALGFTSSVFGFRGFGLWHGDGPAPQKCTVLD
jgi:hypothetical protein